MSNDDKMIEDFKKKESEKSLQQKTIDETVAKVEGVPKKPEGEAELAAKAAGMEQTRTQLIEAREKRVQEHEDRVDKKITDYKKLISEAERHGEALAGDAIVREKTKEEAVTANAKKMLAGTGFEERI